MPESQRVDAYFIHFWYGAFIGAGLLALWLNGVMRRKRAERALRREASDLASRLDALTHNGTHGASAALLVGTLNSAGGEQLRREVYVARGFLMAVTGRGDGEA